MRRLAILLGILVPLCHGCNWRFQYDRTATAPGGKVNPDTPPPQAAQLVAYLNDNAGRVQAIQCNKVDLDCRQGKQSVGLDGMLVCQKPRSFRLKAKVLGSAAADFGSNDREFWYWISQNKPVPYVFHCSYEDLGRGQVRMPFPFQPDMVMTALGLAEYDPNRQYDLKVNPTTLELSENATSPMGQPVRKVTVFNRAKVPVGRPQVVAHILRDDKDKELCRATIHEVHVDNATGAVLPQKVTLSWPAEQMEMTMRLNGLTVVYRIEDPQRVTRMFTRSDLSSMRSFDLARWTEDNASGVSQTNLRQLDTPVRAVR
jgi:hypothetical protein